MLLSLGLLIFSFAGGWGFYQCLNKNRYVFTGLAVGTIGSVGFIYTAAFIVAPFIN